MIGQLAKAPNQLTLLRLVFIPFIIIAILDEHYDWALGLFVLAGISDGLDGLLARVLKQKTVLGQYLDPIADKLLLSTMLVVLAFTRRIPWQFTVLVLFRDIAMVITAGVLYATETLREFPPTMLGKLNTVAQIIGILFVLIREMRPERWAWQAKWISLWTVVALTVASGVHYVILVNRRIRAQHAERQR